jgi:L-histidine N-alpha-methyltransferase
MNLSFVAKKRSDCDRSPPWCLTDLSPRAADLCADALLGLRLSRKRLSSKYFYDARGSELFEAITRQPEYYLTRVETALLDSVLSDIAGRVGPHVHVVELGTGSGVKTQRLLAALDQPVAYTGVEISRSALVEAACELALTFPEIEVLPVCADFTDPVSLPQPVRDAVRTLVFFPGSTLGNFYEDEAVHLLASMRATMGPNGLGLIGLDLVKAPELLEAAYNDAAGVTAAFTLNLLERLNREAAAMFDLGSFAHRAIYSAERQRIETAIVSLRDQIVLVAGEQFAFASGEAIQVEISQKYTDASFARLAGEAGLVVEATWKAPGDAFALVLVGPVGCAGASHE